jgi:uncharacterized membrane protein YgdD (TMEM256/DUF423 family)
MKILLGLAALSGALAVIGGAFGAHGATGKAAEWLRTGAQYEMVHAVAALVAARISGGRGPAILLLGGSLLFAITLYLMALGGPLWLGAITPLGGLGMIAGWAWLAFRAFRS